jgi:ABC-type sugar transport system substrate-binding protein
MGEFGAQAALDAIHGEPVEPLIDTGTEIVTADNADEFGG